MLPCCQLCVREGGGGCTHVLQHLLGHVRAVLLHLLGKGAHVGGAQDLRGAWAMGARTQVGMRPGGAGQVCRQAVPRASMLRVHDAHQRGASIHLSM